MLVDIPDPWRSFLSDLERQISVPITLCCLGGFAVSMAYGLPRPTADIDVCEVIPPDALSKALELAGRGSALHRKHGVYLQMVRIATLPENYLERAHELKSRAFTTLRLSVLDPHDLALSKIERNSDRDMEDVKYLGRVVPLNLDTLEQRYREELRPYLGRPEREDLTLKLWRDAIEEERL